MKKTLFSLAFSILLLAIPAAAQHRGGGGGGQRGGGGNRGGGEQRGGGHVQNQPQRQPRQDNRGRGIERDDRWNGRQAEREFHRDNDRRGYHYSEPRREFRNHWDGRRFDRDYFDAHWGYRHPIYWGHCGWYGRRWAVGSYFWYDGAYFEVIDPIPAYWYNDDVVLVYDEDCDCYYAIDPLYPGIRIHIGVRF